MDWSLTRAHHQLLAANGLSNRHEINAISRILRYIAMDNNGVFWKTPQTFFRRYFQFGWMRNMRYCGLFVLAMSFLIAVNDCDAQQTLFNGSGIKTAPTDNPDGRSGFFDFSKLTGETEAPQRQGFKFPKFEMPKWKAPKLSMPKMFQNNRYPETTQLSDQSNQFKFPTWNSMFPPKDPTQPGFFQRMNEKNREFWGRTRDSFSSWGSKSAAPNPNPATNTWDRITSGFKGATAKNQPPAQPPLRSAKGSEDKDTIKY